jgi:hypothetical protein
MIMRSFGQKIYYLNLNRIWVNTDIYFYKFAFNLGCFFFKICHIGEHHTLLRKLSHTHYMSWVIYLNFLGVITFSPMNYQKMRDASMNYQLDQNRTFNYQRQLFSPISSVRGVKINSQWVMCRFTWGHVGRWW